MEIQLPYINHSGGAVGSDTAWDELGKPYGVISKHYWHGRRTFNGNLEITEDEFEEGKKHVLLANKTLHRKPEKYMDLLARNYNQVRYSESIYAISTFSGNQVKGGTGWAVQMAIDDKKPVFLFDQAQGKWFTWKEGIWIEITTPILTHEFAGIGTREINTYGLEAIRNVYKMTFGW